MKKIRFIINPKSGVSNKKKLPELIEKNIDKTKFSFDIVFTQHRNHAKLLTQQAIADKIDIVCAVGGDGSVHEVGTSLIHTKVALAIIPIGSGNGLARHLGISTNIVKAIKQINQLKIISMDTVFANDKAFLGTAGYGFDALIAKEFDLRKRRGFWGYAYIVFKEYFTFKPVEIKVQTESETHEGKMVLCSLANASEFGNGFTLSPNSNVSDGNIELCLIRPFSILNLPYLLWLFFQKSLHESGMIDIIPIKKARIFVDYKFAHYDGETFKVRKEINIEVKPNSLQVLVGKK